MIKKSIAMLAVTALFLPLFSQEGGDEEDVILVSASKIDEELSRTSENVQVITRQMLEQSGSHTLSDALNSIPGLSFIGKTVGNSEPLQMNGFTDEYVKILVDGVPLSTGGSSKDVSSTQHDDGYYQPFTKTLSGLLKGEWKITDEHSLSSYFSARRYESGSQNQNFSGSWHDATSKEFVDFEGEVLYTGYISEDQQLMAGLNSQYSGYNDDNADSETEVSFKTANLSLFGQDSITFDSLVLVPGFRAFFSLPIDEDHDTEPENPPSWESFPVFWRGAAEA